MARGVIRSTSPRRSLRTRRGRRLELRWALGLAAGLCALAASAPSPAQRREPVTTLPLAVSVASWQGGPVVADAWVDAQVDRANDIFGDHGVTFRVTRRDGMEDGYARLENRRDRHRLGALLHERVIDCFIVLSLRDVDDPSRYRQGVHWRPRGSGGGPRAHIVIVSSVAGPTVLAHELGHYFGNDHSSVPGNIMSYDRAEVPPFFDAAQARRIRASLARFLRGGELVGLGEARAAP